MSNPLLEPRNAGAGAQASGVPVLALRPREAAKALGVSERTLWSWTGDGLIPCVRIGTGRTVLYPVEMLRRWLEEQMKSSPPRHPPADAPGESGGTGTSWTTT
jgi:excisionase family DNA binding protein